MIPADQMVAFGNAVKTGEEPREGMGGRFLMRNGDQELDASGVPEIPAEFESMFNAPIIEASVVELVDWIDEESSSSDGIRVHVRLDLGLSEGAYKGMDLVLKQPEIESYIPGEILEADQSGSLAEIRLDEDDPQPRIGWTFVRDRQR